MTKKRIAFFSIVLLAATGYAVSPAAVDASAILAPGIGVPDSAMNGASVARPRTPSYAAFANPAAISYLPDKMQSFSLGVGLGDQEIDPTFPPGYSDTDHPLVLMPDMGVSVRGNGGWSYGFATYGSVGTAFRFADAFSPSGGTTKSELAVITLAPMVAYRFSDELSVGVSVTPLYGQLQLRFTVPTQGAPVPVNYKVSGPGVQAMLGLSWNPSKNLSFGLGVRSPGMVWMDGSVVKPGGVRAGMNLDLQMPMQVFAGVERRVFERLRLALAGRWTDASSFGNSIISTAGPDRPEDGGAFADYAFIPDANDEWRISAGAEYELSDFITLYAGAGYANSITGNRGTSWLIYDVEDLKAGAGLSLAFDAFSLDLMFGRQFEDSRTISQDQALVLPGAYRGAGNVIFIGLRREG